MKQTIKRNKMKLFKFKKKKNNQSEIEQWTKYPFNGDISQINWD